jgi:hypothetical protein
MTVHIANEPTEDVQTCIRCGALLTDNRHRGTHPSVPLIRWWPINTAVKVSIYPGCRSLWPATAAETKMLLCEVTP